MFTSEWPRPVATPDTNILLSIFPLAFVVVLNVLAESMCLPPHGGVMAAVCRHNTRAHHISLFKFVQFLCLLCHCRSYWRWKELAHRVHTHMSRRPVGTHFTVIKILNKSNEMQFVHWPDIGERTAATTKRSKHTFSFQYQYAWWWLIVCGVTVWPCIGLTSIRLLYILFDAMRSAFAYLFRRNICFQFTHRMFTSHTHVTNHFTCNLHTYIWRMMMAYEVQRAIRSTRYLLDCVNFEQAITFFNLFFSMKSHSIAPHISSNDQTVRYVQRLNCCMQMHSPGIRTKYRYNRVWMTERGVGWGDAKLLSIVK